ncbi:NAD(P)-dependent oxidoreductase [Rhodococcus koreensis]
MPSKVGFVGAGRMGQPMLERIAAAGLPVNVLARSDGARTRQSKFAGVTTASTAAEAAADAGIVAVVVHTDTQVREVCFDGGLLAAMVPGSVLIVHTTGSPFTAHEIAAAAAERDVAVVDAPVSGGPHDISAGSIAVFAGGTEAAFKRARPVLECYADPLFHVGPLGSGQIVKLVNNAIFLSNVEVVDAATRFGEELGLDVATMMQCLQQGSARSAALEGVVRAGSAKTFRSSVAEFLHKDALVVQDVSKAMGADLGCIASLLPRLELPTPVN